MEPYISLGYTSDQPKRSRLATAGFVLGLTTGPSCFALGYVKDLVFDPYADRTRLADAVQYVALFLPIVVAIVCCGLGIIMIASSSGRLRGMWFAVTGLLLVLAWVVFPFFLGLLTGFG